MDAYLTKSENVVSDDKGSKQKEVPKGILQLRKQMLNQEYEALEEQRRQMQVDRFSQGSKGFEAEYETPRDIADEYSDSRSGRKNIPNETQKR